MNVYVLLLGDVLRRLRWQFLVLVAWIVLVGLSEGFSIVLLLPVLNRIGIAVGGNQGVVVGLIDNFLMKIGADSASKIVGVVIAIATLQMILSVGLNFWMVRVARGYQSQRQLELFTSFMRSKWVFLTDRRAGEMTAAIVTECERLGRAFTLTLALLGSVIIAAIYVVLSALIAWQATLCIIVLALVSGLGMFRMYRTSYAVGERLTPLNAQLQSLLDEQFAGAKLIKASAGINRAVAQIKPLIGELEEASTIADVMPGTVRGVLEYVGVIGVAIILVLATNGFGMAPASVVVVLALFGRLFPRVTTVQSQLHSLNNNVHAVEAIDELQTAADSAAERPDPLNAVAALVVHSPALLVVRDLTVKFGDRCALDDIELRLPIPGLVAVVGGSGAGKSTLVHTILGLTEPSAGSIRLGNNDFAATPLSTWRRAIGYVPQETILFHASIRDNLTFINPAAFEADVETAARRADAHDFIMALPERYDTIIGDQGVKLSGGQRQRLGIARALLTNPHLLILDEAMSALDAASEAEILRTLEELRGQIGILMIAHRLASVRSADSIYVFDEGRVAESGTWDTLMARRGHLHALAKAQGLDRMMANAV